MIHIYAVYAVNTAWSNSTIPLNWSLAIKKLLLLLYLDHGYEINIYAVFTAWSNSTVNCR